MQWQAERNTNVSSCSGTDELKLREADRWWNSGGRTGKGLVPFSEPGATVDEWRHRIESFSWNGKERMGPPLPSFRAAVRWSPPE